MRVFLSYASQDRALARSIELALREHNYNVFFDRDDLPPGEEFNNRIRRAIEQADLVIFLISPESVDAGSYTITEVEIAEQARKNPSGRILPVIVRPTPIDSIPPYLKSVTLFETQGNLPASVTLAVQRIASIRHRQIMQWVVGALAIATLIGIAAYSSLPDRTKGSSVAGALSANGNAPTAESAATSPASHEVAPTITGTDGAPGVLIPAGQFIMGDDENSPQREIYVDSFYLDQHEVTIARYARFLKATSAAETPLEWESANVRTDGELPVIGVDWNEANAYCHFAGRRLPSEAEWEKAARGTDGRKFPWGNESPNPSRANYENSSSKVYGGGLTTVGHFPLGQSPYGVDDLAGNAAEWVADWYSESFVRGDVRNPHGPETGTGKVIRGGGRFEPAYLINATKRYSGSRENRDEQIGFRCARDVK